MSDDRATRAEQRGSALWITLNRPQARNALSAELVASLLADLRAAQSDPRARVIVLTGAGSAFCAGADLKNRGDMGGAGRNPFVEILRLVRHGEKPVIAAVNGHAFGGGLGLVAAADIAIGADSALMSFSEVRIGAVPAMISVVVLPKVGPHQTMRLFLTGERFDARKAQGYGLLHQVVPAAELERAVDAEVHAIAQGGPNAVREAKQLIRTVERLAEDEAFAFAEKKIAELFASDEAREGMRAFAEKRPPSWVPKQDG
ncbi:MAG TPA: enoyl-CoA hydratase-related protein [Myxococcota bacterium]|nr:enoyl-CoA hydratase-related protein [Myxococcota bacterium]